MTHYGPEVELESKANAAGRVTFNTSGSALAASVTSPASPAGTVINLGTISFPTPVGAPVVPDTPTVTDVQLNSLYGTLLATVDGQVSYLEYVNGSYFFRDTKIHGRCDLPGNHAVDGVCEMSRTFMLLTAVLAAESCLTFKDSDDLPVCSGINRFGVCNCLLVQGCSFCEDDGFCSQIHSRKCKKVVTELPLPMCAAWLPSDGGTEPDAGVPCDVENTMACTADTKSIVRCQRDGDALKLVTVGSCPNNGKCLSFNSAETGVFQCTGVGGNLALAGVKCPRQGKRACSIENTVMYCQDGLWQSLNACGASECLGDTYRPPDAGNPDGYVTCGGDGRVNAGDRCTPGDRTSSCSTDQAWVLGCNDAGVFMQVENCASANKVCQPDGVCQ